MQSSSSDRPFEPDLERLKNAVAAEGRRNNGVEPALIPSFSLEEKVKRSQCFGILPRLDWWRRIKQPDDSKGFSFALGEKVGMRAGNSLSN
jgi:hypothetical protein